MAGPVRRCDVESDAVWPRRANSIMLSMTSAARRCQHATNSPRAKSVQAMCRQAVGVSPQLSCCIMFCGFRDAGAIPAASSFCVLIRFNVKACV